MHEVLEANEEHGGHEDSPFSIPGLIPARSPPCC